MGFVLGRSMKEYCKYHKDAEEYFTLFIIFNGENCELANINCSRKYHPHSFVENLGEILAVKFRNCTVEVKNNSFVCIFSITSRFIQ